MSIPVRRSMDAKKMAVIGVLGVASGIPSALMGDAFKAWARESQVSLAAVGALTLLTLPVGIKFLWSPWLDRPLAGLPRRKGWLIILQTLVALLTGAMAFFDPAGSLQLVALIVLGLAFASASLDVVVDAYRADRLTVSEVGMGSAFAIAGWRIGNMFSQSVIFFLAARLGWPLAYALMAMLQALMMIGTWQAAEPRAVAPPPLPFAGMVTHPFRIFFRTHGVGVAVALLIFAAVFKASDALGNSLATAFLVDQGYDGDLLGLRGALGMPMAIIGGMLGGFLLPRLGFTWGLIIGGLLQAASNLSYLPLIGHAPGIEWIVFLAVVENLCSGIAVAAFAGFLLTCCVRQWSGTQYALLSSVMFLGAIGLGSVAGFLAEALGYWHFFLTTVVVGLLGVALVPLVVRRVDQFIVTEELPGPG